MKCHGCGISFTVEARFRNVGRKYHSIECANRHVNPPKTDASPRSIAQRERRHARAASRPAAVKGLSAAQVACRRALGLPC